MNVSVRDVHIGNVRAENFNVGDVAAPHLARHVSQYGGIEPSAMSMAGTFLNSLLLANAITHLQVLDGLQRFPAISSR
ncbi:MAG: hypothetical protein WKF37_08665 [Bryobacteraceae bacterium]